MSPRLHLRVLGPVEVFEGAAAVAVEGPTRRRVLAVLAAARGAVVPSDRLVDALWGADPPEIARASLQSHVSHLRRSLGSPSTIVGSAEGYSLATDEVGLDATQFEQATAPPHPEGETDADKVERLRDALSRWRGRAFGEFAEVPGVRSEALRLEELRPVATEELVDARLARGRHVEVIAELEALVVEHPLRECFWRQLMLALHRSDRPKPCGGRPPCGPCCATSSGSSRPPPPASWSSASSPTSTGPTCRPRRVSRPRRSRHHRHRRGAPDARRLRSSGARTTWRGSSRCSTARRSSRSAEPAASANRASRCVPRAR